MTTRGRGARRRRRRKEEQKSGCVARLTLLLRSDRPCPRRGPCGCCAAPSSGLVGACPAQTSWVCLGSHQKPVRLHRRLPFLSLAFPGLFVAGDSGRPSRIPLPFPSPSLCYSAPRLRIPMIHIKDPSYHFTMIYSHGEPPVLFHFFSFLFCTSLPSSLPPRHAHNRGVLVSFRQRGGRRAVP